jgi:thiol-disulfide isomerase/thioredoxin
MVPLADSPPQGSVGYNFRIVFARIGTLITEAPFMPADRPVRLLLTLLTLIFLVHSAAAEAAVQDEPPAGEEAESGPLENPFPRAVKIPDGIMDGGAAWLNTSRPLSLEDLRGKVVLLDFWTYCCINCMHILPDLKYLEEKYADQLVVIGVHSAKFDNEKDSVAIREAMMRYEIRHPVVNDNEMLIWRKFGIRAWPTVALIDPEGRFCGSQSGEGHRELLDAVIGRLVDYHRQQGTLDETPVLFPMDADSAAPTPLRYPGKICLDQAGSRLFITDSNHNRIVVAGLDGKLQAVIGSGREGALDGSFAEAEFSRPQGTVLVGQTLYVADTENHLIRAVDLEQQQVATLAGTGKQGRPGMPPGDTLLQTALNSPWSIAHTNETLYIAMAGPHQVWSHKLGTQAIGVYAGSGREDVTNGPLPTSAFAQPSEIVVDAGGEFLYLVDSEGSAIRRVPLDPEGIVTTVAGTSELPRGQSLFAFGDQDGRGADARFQHPLGIAAEGDHLIVADSYNHKLRRISLESSVVTTWLGDGTAGDELEPLQFSEPGGLAVGNGILWVADTNNHRILKILTETDAAEVFEVEGLEPPRVVPRSQLPDPADILTVAAQQLAPTEAIEIEIQLQIPSGYKLNPDFPSTWSLFADSEQTLVGPEFLASRQQAEVTAGGQLRIRIPVMEQTGSATLILEASYGYCDSADAGLCRQATASWKIPFVFNEAAEPGSVVLKFPPPASPLVFDPGQ